MPDLNQPNDYGIHLHACNGYRHDEHWWMWIRWRTQRGEFGEALRVMSVQTWGEIA